MIEIPRSLARQFRAVLRRAHAAQESRGSWPLVLCQADGLGLTLQARQGDVAARYHLPGERAAEALAFRASAFAEFEGGTPDPVSLEGVASGRGRVGEPGRADTWAQIPSTISRRGPRRADQRRQLRGSTLPIRWLIIAEPVLYRNKKLGVKFPE